jgi:hypothetical protein
VVPARRRRLAGEHLRDARADGGTGVVVEQRPGERVVVGDPEQLVLVPT